MRDPTISSEPTIQTGICYAIFAYDAARDRLFVTGKLWPRMFEIRVIRAD